MAASHWPDLIEATACCMANKLLEHAVSIAKLGPDGRKKRFELHLIPLI